ncbi:hypothetical protein KIW84_032061 [Lathyrus oleraceus]|uniref:Uncharacterized protein n=1 Tax=Pisum sativum TaxID=3888 RepID=A0A9D4XXJ3_PEA|nr:hypothetical protein KIW84_032061 [Pisum sativum]
MDTTKLNRNRKPTLTDCDRFDGDVKSDFWIPLQNVSYSGNSTSTYMKPPAALQWILRVFSAERWTGHGDEFLENMNYYAKSWLPARSIVMEYLAARETIDSSGEIIKLNRSCPWRFHIHELQEEMKINPSIKYVL